jgi:hypothetical protein
MPITSDAAFNSGLSISKYMYFKRYELLFKELITEKNNYQQE